MVEVPLTVDGLLDSVGLWECRRKRMRSLSGGQRQRVGLALVLHPRPAMILTAGPGAW